MSLDETLQSTLKTLREHIPERLLAAKVGIVCGSGLSTLADNLRDIHKVPYDVLEGFGHSTGMWP